MRYEKDLEATALNYHDKILKGWENLYSLMRNALYERFIFNVPFKGSVLELGCGDGEMTKGLVKSFEEVTVVDGSSTMLKESEKRLAEYNNIEFIESYFEHFSTNKKFDVIIMSHILEHMDNPIELLTRVKGFLKEEGLVFIAVPNADSLHRQVAVEMDLLASVHTLNEQDLLLGHRRVYNFETLNADCKAAGYQILNQGGIMLKPLTNRQIEKQWTAEMIEGFMKLGDKYPELAAEIYVVLKNR